MTSWPTARIHGRVSYLVKTRLVNLAITGTGGMLGPVTFFAEEHIPIRPYAIAPWAEEPLPPRTPSMIAALRGDWFCSAFGEKEAYATRQPPPHGAFCSLLLDIWGSCVLSGGGHLGVFKRDLS